MKKVLFALDGNQLSEDAFEMIRHLNEGAPIIVVGVYIPAFINSLSWSAPIGDEALYIPRLLEEDEALVRGHVQEFKDACIKYGIEHRVHGNAGAAILENVQKETRYADLFVIGFETYYKNSDQDFIHEELKEIIETAECPVLLVPKGTSFPESIVIGFDGSKSCVKALKMISYVLPELSALPTIITYVHQDDQNLPDEKHIKELATRHFSNVSFLTLNFEPKKYFATWMADRPKPLLVTGSYGRSDLSQIFRRSFISEIIREHNLPVFIDHS